MTLIEKFNATIISLGDVKQFIERAETLGYKDRTPIGPAGIGIDLWIESPQGAEAFRCSENGCGKEFGLQDMARSYYTAQWMLPAHANNQRGLPCKGSGAAGVAVR